MFAKSFRADAARGLAIVPSLRSFHRCLDAFTEGSLRHLTWDNVLLAGGAVLACLTSSDNTDVGALRQQFHEGPYRNGDIDLFLYGLTHEQALVKMQQIFEEVCAAVPHNVVAFRTKNTITLVSQYPFKV